MAILELAPFERALDRAREGRPPTAAEAAALLDVPAERLPDLFTAAAALRDRGRGRRIRDSTDRGTESRLRIRHASRLVSGNMTLEQVAQDILDVARSARGRPLLPERPRVENVN